MRNNQKNKLLVAFDSDGCVFDGMDIKHKKCFGPAAVEVFGFQSFEGEFLEEWNRVNLYSKTRGVNRFWGLVKTFEIMQSKGHDMPDISLLKAWCNKATTLSVASLQEELKHITSAVLNKIVKWSHRSNEMIQAISKDIKPFENAVETIEMIAETADISVVSSANTAALNNEWELHNLTRLVEKIYGQEYGNKAKCLKELRKNNYTSVLMVGDAPGDKIAADEAECLFYPIIPGNEIKSWEMLRNVVFEDYRIGKYRTPNEYIEKFASVCQ